VKKNATTPEAPAPVVLPGNKTEVVAPSVVVHLVRSEAGTPIMLAERAPTIGGGPSVPWIPLFGLLGGAVLLHGFDHGSSPETPTPPIIPPDTTSTKPPVTPPDTTSTTPPVTPPDTTVTTPPPPPPTTVPEPATIVLFATGLLAVAAVSRRLR
jgi:hypothetical protein